MSSFQKTLTAERSLRTGYAFGDEPKMNAEGSRSAVRREGNRKGRACDRCLSENDVAAMSCAIHRASAKPESRSVVRRFGPR